MKTTKKHFEIFKEEFQKWVEIFGLKNWEINFYHEDDNESSLAWTGYNFHGKVVDAYLAKTWGNRFVPSDFEVRKCAFHEACEILLYPLRYLAEERFLKNGEINTEVHNVIRTLENVLFKEV